MFLVYARLFICSSWFASKILQNTKKKSKRRQFNDSISGLLALTTIINSNRFKEIEQSTI